MSSPLPETMPTGLCPGRMWLRCVRPDGELILSETLRDDDTGDLFAELAGVLAGVDCLHLGLYDGETGQRIGAATVRVTRK